MKSLLIQLLSHFYYFISNYYSYLRRNTVVQSFSLAPSLIFYLSFFSTNIGARTATQCLLGSAFFTPRRRPSRHRTYSLPTPTHGNTRDKCHGSFHHSLTMDAFSLPSRSLFMQSLCDNRVNQTVREPSTLRKSRQRFDAPPSIGRFGPIL